MILFEKSLFILWLHMAISRCVRRETTDGKTMIYKKYHFKLNLKEEEVKNFENLEKRIIITIFLFTRFVELCVKYAFLNDTYPEHLTI